MDTFVCMLLKRLTLQNFRNYSKSEFNFGQETSLIVGPNTSGKTNLIEAIFFLSTGKSFRTEKDEQAIKFGENVARVEGLVSDTKLEVVIASGDLGRGVTHKKYMVNGVAKRRIDFMGNLLCVLFSPLDLDMVVGAPGLRRNFLNNVLEATDIDYRRAYLEFTKALRQRNALLEKVKEAGVRNEKQFEYWDMILIQTGNIITQKREKFIEFINTSKKDIFDFIVLYDKSVISKDRLLQYKNAEAGAGVTLVGPHRDDFSIRMHPNEITSNKSESMDIKFFGSRGQQRLVVLQLKILELSFIEKQLGQGPILLLDDIFSELDEKHIELVLAMLGRQQTIITTTHKEFIPKKILESVEIIELGVYNMRI